MNKDNAHLYMPLIQALADGKTIQIFSSRGEYEDSPNPDFRSSPRKYRIKPEPIEFWVNVYPNNERVFHASEMEADLFAQENRIRCARLVEVID